MSLVKISEISAGYSKENVIDNITFEINEGELVGILGLNGSGKSTLIKSVCNILPHSGTVSVNDRNIEKLKISQTAEIISYIPQQSGIGIDISVFDVVKMGFNPRLKLFEKPDATMEAKAKEIINLLGLEDKIYTNYMMLSEGQKQLAVIARALVSEGSFLVMDEPESALDFNVRVKIIKYICDWISKNKRAGLVILHDVILALNSCDKLILLKCGKMTDVIDLHNDSVETMEGKLREIYGNISLVKTKSNSGKDNLIMLFDSEEI